MPKSTSNKKTNNQFSVKVTKIEDNRVFFTEKETYPFPDLLDVQKKSFQDFLMNGIKELIEEVSPISDFSGKKLELQILDHKIENPKYTASDARRRNLSYEALITSHVQLINKETGEIKEQDIFLGTIPLMTDKGTFIVNGIERVVVNQLVRSPGAFFSKSPTVPGMYNVKIIPKRGAWLELETDKKGVIYAKIDRKRKFPVTQLLRIMGFDTDKKIIDEFAVEGLGVESDFIRVTLDKDNARSVGEAYQAVYRKVRPGDLATTENAKLFIEQMFFDYSKYDMGPIARYKLNKRFGFKLDGSKKDNLVFQPKDFVAIIQELIRLNHKGGDSDDIDHLSNRRVRSVGELISNKFRIGLMRMERIIKDRMTIIESEQLTPVQLINSRPVTAALREFFVGSQLSQFMDQTNPLAELAHKRRLSAMGPGGLSRERASFEVRDVHTSHYGRICPIATPEGPNIGLVLHLASYAKVNDYGFIETPFRVVKNVAKNGKEAIGRILAESYGKDAKAGTVITDSLLSKIKDKEIKVRPFITNEVYYYDADNEVNLVIAQANSNLDDNGNFLDDLIASRVNGKPVFADVSTCTHIDISPKQIVSEFTALIPFLEHDDNTRASMGANMIRQAVSLVKPSAPLVGTGLEGMIARATGQGVVARKDGKIIYADGKRVEVMYEDGKKEEVILDNYLKSNQGTAMHMKCLVSGGQAIKKGDVLVDGSATKDGELALGQNVLVAYMPWRGYNFEDAVIVSNRMLEDSMYDSVHIKEYIADVRDTKLGPEQTTRDIPNVGETRLKNLDNDGVIRVGATVNEGDILVGKITPKGETEQTPEERLLQAIFGEKAKDIKDTSLRVGGGEQGKVVDIQIFTRSNGDELPVGVIKQIRVYIAQTRKLQVGDKMAGRHGNKGVVAKIVPKEDMPFLADGTPIDIILNPLGVASRMNVGQVFETHLGWAAKMLGIKIASPALNGIRPDSIEKIMKDGGVTDKVQLYDGRTGEPFFYKTTVGVKYMFKLGHLVEDKIHARSVGPYSLVTQQPLGGKAQHGGQRFGEMEVWALEGYGAAHTLQEMLTIKSDDVMGRARAYEDIVKGEKIRKPSIPESFSVLVHELRGLCLNVDLMQVDLDKNESLKVELKTFTAKDIAESDIPDEDKISELEDEAIETEDVIESEMMTEGEGESAEDEMKDAEFEKEE